MSLLLAAVLAAAAVLIGSRARAGDLVGQRLGPAFAAPADVGTAGSPSRRGPWSRLVQPLAMGVLAAAVLRLTAGRPHLVVLGLTAVGVAWAVSTLVAKRRRRRSRLSRRAHVVSMCDALVAELQSGQPPAAAMETVALEWPELAVARDAARLGGDVPAALRALSRQPGAEPLGRVAAGWQVAMRSGAGLAEVLDRLSTVLRADDQVRREVEANLASPRATAVMLAVLPVFGLGLGTAIGADPARVLLGTLLGAWCLAIGCLLAALGLFWVERITDAAEV